MFIGKYKPLNPVKTLKLNIKSAKEDTKAQSGKGTKENIKKTLCLYAEGH